MKSLKTLAGVGARDIFAFLSGIGLNPFFAKFFFSHWFFHYFWTHRASFLRFRF